VHAPFRPLTHRSVDSPICATVASSSVFTTEKNTRISQVYQGLSPPIMATTPYYGGQSTPFEPVCSSHFLAPKGVQPAPALQRLDPHGYEPVCLSPMPPPAARQTNAARKQNSCNRFGCAYKSTFPGNVGRHYTFSCELRNAAERHYADQLTTCYLCETKPKYSRPDVLRRHIRRKHLGFKLDS